MLKSRKSPPFREECHEVVGHSLDLRSRSAVEVGSRINDVSLLYILAQLVHKLVGSFYVADEMYLVVLGTQHELFPDI